MDLSLGRMASRWRKLRRDPASFADDLPWPALRLMALGGLAAATGATDMLDGETRLLARQWAEAGVSLRRGEDGAYRFAAADGAVPALTPRRLWLAPLGRRLIACAFDAEDGFLAGAEVDPEAGGVLALPGEAETVRVYPLDGAALPDQMEVAPVGRRALMRQSHAQGADLAGALHAAWPAAERRSPEPSAGDYAAWIARNEPHEADHPAIRAWAERQEGLPLISVLMPVHDPRPEHLRAAIASVGGQLMDRWELCIADDGSADEQVREILDAAAADPRVKLVRLGVSRGVAVATNAALEQASGEACLFLDHDDRLAPTALLLIAEALRRRPEAVAVYSDEDTLDQAGRRSAPLMKPDFDAERLLAQNYVNHALAVRTDLLRRLGGVRDGVDGAQDHDLVLRVAEAGPILHVPQVLYHWRVYPGGRTLSQRASGDLAAARRRVVTDALARAGRDDAVEAVEGSHLRLRPRTSGPSPSILAVIPTRDRPALLAASTTGLLEHTRYPNLRLRIVDNGSRDPEALALLETLARDERVEVLRRDEPFNFSRLINAAAEGAQADLLLLLNDDILVVEPGWLEAMAALAVRPGVGAVGARLHYPDGRLQHAGLVLGLGPQGIAGHEFRGQAGDQPGPQARLKVTREVSAVTAACLLVAREAFAEVGGMDEDLAVAFNDVDFCLKLRERGRRNLWTPAARLIHLESATRGADTSPERAARFAAEAERMRERWGPLLTSDPFYSPNLTLADESFTLAARSRWSPPWGA